MPCKLQNVDSNNPVDSQININFTDSVHKFLPPPQHTICTHENVDNCESPVFNGQHHTVDNFLYSVKSIEWFRKIFIPDPVYLI
jgi:hypothetical protein